MKKENAKSKLSTPAKDEQKKEDKKWKAQDEFDDKSRDRLELESKISNSSENQKRSDSQQGDERKTPDSHKKQTEKEWLKDRKLPNIKK